ncbi:MAG: CHASE domain-containing protein [Nitrospinae bacterium]|nr:CHASE domain-containing protein [Nitrospinota bacterium]MBF0634266.1 CHASE domain-containing protein [Nitrospinota bacterium]
MTDNIEPDESSARMSHYIFAALVFGVGALLSYAIYFKVKEVEEQRFTLEFERRVGTLPVAFQNGINSRLNPLVALSEWIVAQKKSGIFDDYKSMRSEFQAVSERLRGPHGSLLFLAFLPRVPAGEATVFEETARKNGFINFTVRGQTENKNPASGGAAFRYPIYLVEPVKGNEALIGLDAMSHTVLRNTLEAAFHRKEISASARSAPIEGKKDYQVIFAAVPLFASAAAKEKPEPGQLFGYALAVYSLGTMIEESLKGIDMSGVALHLYDMQDTSIPAEERFLYESRENPPSNASRSQELASIMNGPNVTRNINMAGRAWSIVAHPAPENISAFDARWHPSILLFSGVTISLLLAGYILRSQAHTAMVERLVAKRTATIIRVNENLKEEIALRWAAEEKARQQDLEIAHAMRLASLGEMAAGISHEINQPLTAILNYAENAILLLQKGPENDGIVTENLKDIAGQVRRAKNVITHLKGYARSQDEPRSLVDVNELIRGVADFLSYEMRQRGIELTMDLFSHLSSVKGDPLRLEQVFVNVLLNAAQSIARDAGGKIIVRTGPGGDGRIAAEIEDNGCGMGVEVMENLFKPFFTTKPRDEGTGLGLAISKRILIAHGGSISAKSQTGRGSVFTITLPAQSNLEREKDNGR